MKNLLYAIPHLMLIGITGFMGLGPARAQETRMSTYCNPLTWIILI
jgi:hypothetical protein